MELDTLTGDWHLLRTDLVMDVGDSLNPAIDIGQAHPLTLTLPYVAAFRLMFSTCLLRADPVMNVGDSLNPAIDVARRTSLSHVGTICL